MRPGLQLHQVGRAFSGLDVLKNINFYFQSGGQYVIRGASGSGKSSLLYLLGGLDRPTTGEIICDGYLLNLLSDDQLAVYRNVNVGFIFQFHYLLPTMSAWDNILLPARIGGKVTKILKDQMQDLAQSLGISQCLSKHPYQLSGGEQQRINVMRALSMRPRYLLCDEPTGNLDSKNSLNVIKIICDLAKELAATLIVVTHDQNIASFFSQQIFLEDGQLAL